MERTGDRNEKIEMEKWGQQQRVRVEAMGGSGGSDKREMGT